jgi:outer membrane protein assembly factor BamA
VVLEADRDPLAVVLHTPEVAVVAEEPRGGRAAGGDGGRAASDTGRLEGAVVRGVAVRGASRVRESVVLRAFTLQVGRPFRMEDALRGMDAVYATRLFDSVWLDAAPAEDGVALTVEVREATKVTLEVGGGYDEADEARGFLRIRSRNVFGRGERSDTTLLASDGEVGIRSAFTAERPFGLPFGVFTRGARVAETPRLFRDDRELGRAEYDRQGVAAGLQRRLGYAALVRVGGAWGTVQTRRVRGVPETFEDRDTLATLLGEVAWDTLDDPAVPGTGAAIAVTAERAFPGLGASRDYWRVRARGQAAITPARRLVLRGQGLLALAGRDLPEYEQARIGGPLWIPGVHREGLWGPQALAGSLTAGVALVRDLRLLGRVGAGNVWDLRSDVGVGDLRWGLGVGLELPTRAGPIVLDWGRSRGISHVSLAVGFPWTRPLTP